MADAMITITPEPGSYKFVAQALLTLADHPRDVATVSRPERGFRVSVELFEKFELLMIGEIPKVEETVVEEKPKPAKKAAKKAVPTTEEGQ